ncbi:hypothetical protein HMPREF2926_08595 [Streptococcus sp. HMSC078D09]|nr:hypothetical protein HMPREF2926_08595 [Streptococcus sp. HMSC078D09]
MLVIFSSFLSPFNSFLLGDLTHEHIDQRMALKKQIIHTKSSMNGLMFFYKSYYIRKDFAMQEKSSFDVRFSNMKRYCSS